jgi:hypothetical protein
MSSQRKSSGADDAAIISLGLFFGVFAVIPGFIANAVTHNLDTVVKVGLVGLDVRPGSAPPSIRQLYHGGQSVQGRGERR